MVLFSPSRLKKTLRVKSMSNLILLIRPRRQFKVSMDDGSEVDKLQPPSYQMPSCRHTSRPCLSNEFRNPDTRQSLTEFLFHYQQINCLKNYSFESFFSSRRCYISTCIKSRFPFLCMRSIIEVSQTGDRQVVPRYNLVFQLCFFTSMPFLR